MVVLPEPPLKLTTPMTCNCRPQGDAVGIGERLCRIHRDKHEAECPRRCTTFDPMDWYPAEGPYPPATIREVTVIDTDEFSDLADVNRRRCLRAFGGNSFVRWA